jgi:hypothetical protein
MITKTREQIDSLPSPPPENALNEVAKLIRDFNWCMRIEGIPDNVTQHIRVLCKDFGAAIRETAPEFGSCTKLQEEGDSSSGESSNSGEKHFYVDIPQE